MRLGITWVTLILLVVAPAANAVSIGSKAFTEGYLLGEIAAQTLERGTNLTVMRHFGLGGTGILFEALRTGNIDVYPEYTGTISEAILKDPSLRSWEDIRARIRQMGLEMSRPLGFSNTYALAVTRAFAQTHRLRTISDLRQLNDKVRAGFSHEFLSRADGWAALAARYDLQFKQSLQSMEHSLAFEAITKGAVDLIDVYSTDAKIVKLNLQVLTDDLGFFPQYQAVLLTRQEFIRTHPEAWKTLQRLEGTLSETDMMRLNATVDLDKKGIAAAAADFLSSPGERSSLEPTGSDADQVSTRILKRTREHLLLVTTALGFSVLVGIPLGILADRNRWLGQAILLLSGSIQTIPSLALLCFLIPIFGIGMLPALVALCLYGLLPVVVNTFVGLRSIDPTLKEMAHVLGFSGWQRLLRIELPLAIRSILAGVKTSMVISIGTATLAALIGAGGYGAPIVMGLALNDMNTILLGAIPASLMAIFAHLFFDAATRFLVPKALR
ncbi:MAG: glycine betaine ABC transporter substrate-binding protein [Bdellovibrionales bacterium]